MSEEPLFDPSLKKRKKKTVAFSEDPLGAEADPTTPAPVEIDNVTANGDVVDMGTTTVHERMKQNGVTGEVADDAEKEEDDDFKAMFGDLKKKKKKKEIPLDLVRIFASLHPLDLSIELGVVIRAEMALVPPPPPSSPLHLRISTSPISRKRRRNRRRRLHLTWKRSRRS